VREPGEHDWRDMGGEPRDGKSRKGIAVGGTNRPPVGIGSLDAEDWLRLGEELPNGGLRRVLTLWGAVPVPYFRAFAADRSSGPRSAPRRGVRG
jgi:hypothetical protein